jgi:hypothetical protein
MLMEEVIWIMPVSLEVGVYIVWISHNCHSQVSEVLQYGQDNLRFLSKVGLISKVPKCVFIYICFAYIDYTRGFLFYVVVVVVVVLFF